MKKTCVSARLIFLVFGLGLASWAPMVPFAKRRLGLDDAELGVLLLLFGIGALGTMPLSGLLVQRIGSRNLTLISGLLMAVILPFLTFVSNPQAMGLALFLFGASTGALNVSINSQAVAIEKRIQSVLMSGFHCFFSIGGLLGSVITSLLLEAGLPLFFCGLLISSVVGGFIFVKSKELLPQDESTVINKQKFNLKGQDKIIFLGILCFIAFMSEGSMLDWSAEFLISTQNYPSSLAGIGYVFFSLGMIVGRFFGDRMINQFGSLSIFRIGSLTASIGFFMVVYSPWGHTQLIGFILIGLGASNIVPILFSAAGKVSTTSSSSQALSVITSIAYTGILIGPAFIGFIAQAFTLPVAFISIACLLLFVCLSGKAVEKTPVTVRDFKA